MFHVKHYGAPANWLNLTTTCPSETLSGVISPKGAMAKNGDQPLSAATLNSYALPPASARVLAGFALRSQLCCFFKFRLGAVGGKFGHH